jgi:hexosaminidase
VKYLWLLVLVALNIGCKSTSFLQHKHVKLSQPVISVEDVFFEDSCVIKVVRPANNVEVVYSIINGNKIYQNPIRLNESSVITFHSEGDGYLPSSPQIIQVVKLPEKKILAIRSERKLDDRYGKGGLNILNDRKKGSPDFNNGWLGYAGDTIVYSLDFDKREINKLVVSTLRNQDAWIFSPAIIKVYNEGALVNTMVNSDAQIKQENANVFTEIDLKKINSNHLTIRIIAPAGIPSWHSGAGRKPWMFIDEILIY